jgi:hypothetical protein
MGTHLAIPESAAGARVVEFGRTKPTPGNDPDVETRWGLQK